MFKMNINIQILSVRVSHAYMWNLTLNDDLLHRSINIYSEQTIKDTENANEQLITLLNVAAQIYRAGANIGNWQLIRKSVEIGILQKCVTRIK